MPKVYVDWDSVEHFVDVIRSRYIDRKFDGVYGLPRGGLIIAVMISYKLNIPLLNAPTSNSLIVDDICDSGESLLHYWKNSSGDPNRKRPEICTMYYKKNDLGVKPDLHLYEKGNDWIVFPWEE